MSPNGNGKRVDLVFEGGGVKGIALVGAAALLAEEGFEPRAVAGASAGAIVAAAVAAGFDAEELRDTILELDYAQFRDEAWEDQIPLLDRGLSILLDQGIYEGRVLHDWMRDLLEQKGVRTFGDLVHPEFADEPRNRYRLQVIASDVTARRLLVLPRDAGILGVDPDDLSVALAVRMSMSIPIFFEPVRWLNPETGNEHLIVDGGMLSNFPVWLFDRRGVPRWPTFGLLLAEQDPRESIAERIERREISGRGVVTLIEYLKSLVQTMLEAHDRMYLDQADYARTIMIPTLGVSTTDFGISRDRSIALYESGRRAAREFLAEWDFDEYIAAYRTGLEHSRPRLPAASSGGSMSSD